MYAMQYEFDLPADYDMASLRERVTAAMHTLDDRAGLALKAYLFRDRGIGDSPVNQYACFYLWRDTAAMAELLLTGSDRFQNIIRFFGRPAVAHWLGVAAFAGPSRDTPPSMATRHVRSIPVDPDPAGTGLGLAEYVDREVSAVETLSHQDGVHTAVLAVDPRDWRLLTFVLRDGEPSRVREGLDSYRVLHLSAPELENLSDGRVWGGN